MSVLRRALLSFVIVALGIVLFQLPAYAESPSGTWKSDSGNTFIIPLIGNGAFDIIKVAPNGAKSLMSARWVSGMEGTQFSYQFTGVVYTGTFSGNDPNRVRVAGPTQANFWVRVRNPQFGWQGVLGTWQSTSGNVFVIADRGRSFDIIMTAPNGQKTLLQASWIPGMEGTQFAYQFGAVRNVATRMPRDENQIRIESSTGSVNNWTRIIR